MDTLIRYSYSGLFQHITLKDEIPRSGRCERGPEFWEMVRSRIETQQLIVWIAANQSCAGLLLRDESVFFRVESLNYLFVGAKVEELNQVYLGANLTDEKQAKSCLLAVESPYSDRGLAYFRQIGERISDVLSLPFELDSIP